MLKFIYTRNEHGSFDEVKIKNQTNIAVFVFVIVFVGVLLGEDKPKGRKQHSSGKLKFSSSQTNAYLALASQPTLSLTSAPTGVDLKVPRRPFNSLKIEYI